MIFMKFNRFCKFNVLKFLLKGVCQYSGSRNDFQARSVNRFVNISSYILVYIEGIFYQTATTTHNNNNTHTCTSHQQQQQHTPHINYLDLSRNKTLKCNHTSFPNMLCCSKPW